MLVKSLLPLAFFAARVFAAEDATSDSEAASVSGSASEASASASASADAGSESGASSTSAAGDDADVGVNPNEPSGATIAKVGDKLKIQWDAGATWTNMTIQLKTGANQVMKALTVVAEGVDATKANDYTWTVPDVNPYSQIYFFEFTNNGPNTQPATWTTRFTIASSEGSTTPPTETEKVGSSLVGWGNGALATGAASSGSGSGSGSGSAVAAASASATGPSRLTSTSATPSDDSVAVASADSAASSVHASTEASKAASVKESATASKTPAAGAASASASSGAEKLVPGLAVVLAAVAFFA